MADPLDEAIKAIERVERAVDTGLPESVLLEVGHAALTIILLRTKSGLDADGNPFAPYTAEYQRERAKRQLSSRVDLALTGGMLGSMQVSVTGKNEVTLEFSRSQSDKASWINDGTTNMPQREFFALRSQKELEVLAEIAGAAKVEQVEKSR